MNTETQRQTLFKLIVVSGFACAVWMLTVQPVLQSVKDQRDMVKSHEYLIAEYQEHVGSLDSTGSIRVHNQLTKIFQDMSPMISKDDSSSSIHSLINKFASENGVSVSRIESVSTNPIKKDIAGSDQQVLGTSTNVRVEFEGDYNAVVTFMDELVSSGQEIKFSSFRFVPIDFSGVRVNAEVSSVMITSVPVGTTPGGTPNE